jgi:hypothetical protein
MEHAEAANDPPSVDLDRCAACGAPISERELRAAVRAALESLEDIHVLFCDECWLRAHPDDDDELGVGD